MQGEQHKKRLVTLDCLDLNLFNGWGSDKSNNAHQNSEQTGFLQADAEGSHYEQIQIVW